MSDSRVVSFVVIAYNEASNIDRTLTAIKQLDGLGTYEIIVVDDGSSDGTGAIVSAAASEDSHIRLIDLQENRGRGHARRTGIAAARGQFIATVDGDVILPAHWLTRAQAALARHDAVGGLAVPDGDVVYLYRRFGLCPRVLAATNDVPGSNGLYRRSVFDIVQFDSNLREGEDSALNQAMKRHALSLASIPDLLVEHQENKTFGASLRWLFDIGRGATRQLFMYRIVRLPDIAATAFAVSIAAGIIIAVEVSWLGVLLPVLLIALAAVQHVQSRFETPISRWRPIALAVAADSALLTAYFSGRLVGVATYALSRRRLRASAETRLVP